MAQLKDTIVSGNLRVTNTTLTDTLQVTTIKAPTTSGGTTYGPGTSGQILKSNGTMTYWADMPTIPTVNNASLTLKGAGTTVTTFTANSSTNQSLDIVAGSNVTITPDATNHKITIASSYTNTDTKVKVTASTSKAYLIGTTTSPDGTAVEGVGNTGVYMTNGVLTASSIYGSGAESQSTAPTGGYRIYDCRSVNVSPNDGDKAANFYFHMTDMPDTSLWWSVLHMRGWTGDYAAWEIAGPSDSKDQRTKPLYVRTSNTNTAWGSWRKIYDTSNPPTASEVGALASTTKYAGSSSAGGAATSADALNLTHGNELNFSKLGSTGHVWFGYRWNTQGTETSGGTTITTYKFGNADGAQGLAGLEASTSTFKSGNFGDQLIVERTGGANMAGIAFKNTSGVLGYIAADTVDGDLYHYGATDTSTMKYVILDSHNYTSYPLPRNIKHIHTASGTEGSTGWVKIARITVTNLYANHPMTFTIAQRGLMQYRIHLVFVNNGSVAAAAISQFIIARDNSWTDTDNYPRAYIIKPSDGIFDLYIRKTEAYDHIFVVDFTKADNSEGDNYSVTWTNVHAADSAITGGTEAVKKLYLLTTTNYAGSTSVGGAANSANVLNYNNSVTATTSGLQYTHGQITIGAADGNAAEGSNASYKLWSYPTGGTATSSTSANIQNLRLYWSSAYFRDIFLSPNNDMIYHRAVINNSAKPWYVLLDSNNLETYSLHTPDTAKALSTGTGQNMSPITRPQNLHNRSNKLALIPGSNITVEYSTDAGSNWTDMGLTADMKGNLFNDTISATIPIGPNNSTDRTTSMQTRITITCDGRDQMIDQYILWLDSSYQTISIDLQVTYGNATTTFTNIRTGLSCPPWNYQYILNTETKRFGTSTTSAYVNKIRFVIKYTGINGSYKTSKAIIHSIAGYSGIYWGGAAKNNLMIYDHLYTWDNSQNATFPAQLNATGATFTSSSYGALSIKRTGTNNAGIKFYNNGSTYLGSLAIDTVNGTFHRFKTDDSTMYEIIDRSVVRNNTTVGTLGWTSSSADTVIPTVNTIAYWNGAYSGTSSNLAYCNKGAFGTIVTKSTTDYSKVSISRNLTSGTKVGTITIDGTATDLYCQTNSDTKVTQTAVGSTYTNYRPIVISGANSATEGFSPSTTTDGTFITSSLYCQPSSGMLHANIFKAGKASTTDGEIKFYRSGSGNSGEITLKAAAQSTSGTYLLPACGNGSYTLSIGMTQVGGVGNSLVMSNVSGIPTGTLSFKIVFKSNASLPIYSMVEIPNIGDGVDCGGLIQVGDYTDGQQGSLRIVMKSVVIRVTAGSTTGTKTFTATVSPTQKISGSSVSEFTRNVIIYKIYACC